MIPNDVLSQELQVKKLLKDNEVAIFVLTNFNKKEVGRDESTCPEVYSFSKKKTVNDPYTGPKNNIARRVVIGNVISTESVDIPGREPYLKPVTQSVEFVRGYKICNAQQNETYQYLMRRAENESNPYRMMMAIEAREKKALFKLTNDKKEISNALILEDIKYAAQKLIRETISATDLKALAHKLNEHPDVRLHVRAYNPPISEDLQAIKLDLLQKVPLFAKAIIYASKDPKSQIKVQILESVNAGVLVFDEGAFRLLGSEATELHRPGADEDKTESLMKFFMEGGKEGQEAYHEKFVKVLKKALKVDPTR